MFQDLLELLVKVLLIAGALNWGAVATVGTDLVQVAVGYGQVNRFIKIAVGAAGVLAALDFLKKFKTVEAPAKE